jgi:hypothetical protein
MVAAVVAGSNEASTTTMVTAAMLASAILVIWCLVHSIQARVFTRSGAAHDRLRGLQRGLFYTYCTALATSRGVCCGRRVSLYIGSISSRVLVRSGVSERHGPRG